MFSQNVVGDSVGAAVGADVGVAVGVGVGDSVGAAVGETVGADVGDAEGLAVGTAVGLALGALVGAAVGDSVGPALGDAVGLAVGAALGAKVGEAVGTAVGDCEQGPTYASMQSSTVNHVAGSRADAMHSSRHAWGHPCRTAAPYAHGDSMYPTGCVDVAQLVREMPATLCFRLPRGLVPATPEQF